MRDISSTMPGTQQAVTKRQILYDYNYSNYPFPKRTTLAPFKEKLPSIPVLNLAVLCSVSMGAMSLFNHFSNFGIK